MTTGDLRSATDAGSATIPAGIAAPASIEFRAGEGVRITPSDWEARAAGVRAGLLEDGLAESLSEALTSFRFLDVGGRTWSYDSAQWWAWDGQRWATGTPPGSLALQPFTLETLPAVANTPPAGMPLNDDSAEALPTAADLAAASVAPAPVPIGEAGSPVPPTAAGSAAATVAPQLVSIAEADRAVPPTIATPAAMTAITGPVPTSAPSPPPISGGGSLPDVAPPWSPPSPSSSAAQPEFRPTYVVPPGGLPAWSRPDPLLAPEHRLDPGLDVMVDESFPNGWARIVCSNRWVGWVDGRYLVPIGQAAARTVPPRAAPGIPDPMPVGSPQGAPAARQVFDLRSEIGFVALLAGLVWAIAAFVAPYGVLIAILENPWIAGAGIAIIPLLVKVLRSGPPGGREAVMFAVDTAAAAVALILLSPA